MKRLTSVEEINKHCQWAEQTGHAVWWFDHWHVRRRIFGAKEGEYQGEYIVLLSDGKWEETAGGSFIFDSII